MEELVASNMFPNRFNTYSTITLETSIKKIYLAIVAKTG